MKADITTITATVETAAYVELSEAGTGVRSVVRILLDTLPMNGKLELEFVA